MDLKNNTFVCSICGNLSDNDPCSICSDDSRDHETLCIVENPSDIYHIESTDSYHGLYHSLGGVLSPLNGITPGDLSIKGLIDRIETGGFGELIFATSATTEGDATVLYIKNLLKGRNIKFSHLARGIPIGSSLQYAGSKTLTEAIRGREKLTD